MRGEKKKVIKEKTWPFAICLSNLLSNLFQKVCLL